MEEPKESGTNVMAEVSKASFSTAVEVLQARLNSGS